MPIIIGKGMAEGEKEDNNKYERDYVYWQAHQSTSTILPENTMAAFLYAWKLGGIPEADIRTTSDGVIICMHDATPSRTINITNSQKNQQVSTLTFEQIKEWDAGIKTGELYRNERVPALREVFEAMQNKKDRLLYLDLKDVELKSLANLIEEYGIVEQIIFTHNNEENCRIMHETVKGLPTMLWIGGSKDKIKDKFNKVLAEDFYGLNQVQIHLNNEENTNSHWPYEIDSAFLEYAYGKTFAAGVDLEVLPFEFGDKDLHALLDIGIRWFAIDYPERFIETVKLWRD